LWGGGASSACGPGAEARRISRVAVARRGRRRRGGKGADERGQAVRGGGRERARVLRWRVRRGAPIGGPHAPGRGRSHGAAGPGKERGPAGEKRSGRLCEGDRAAGRTGPLGWPAFLFPFLFFFKPTQIYLNSNQISIQLLCTQPNKTFAPA
jgi:hypothetical protein